MEDILKKISLITVFVCLCFFNGFGQITLFASAPTNANDSSDQLISATQPIMLHIAKYGESNNPKVILYPNSNHDRLDIEVKDDQKWDMLIFNKEGKLIRLGLLDPGKNKVSLKDILPGIYFVYMSNGEDRWVKKIKKN